MPGPVVTPRPAVTPPASVAPPATTPPATIPGESEPWNAPISAPVAADAVPPTTSAPPRTSWDRRTVGERRRPTTSEQAVPWLIGIVLALAGIVLVLLALIFTSQNGLAAVTGSPRGSASIVVVPSPSSSISASFGAATPTASPSAATPAYGPLEMVYLSRTTVSAPVYLFRRDFSVTQEAETLARADQGVERFAWSPDGRIGAALISGRVTALQPGHAARALIDGMVDIAFGTDSATVYAVRVTRSGTKDKADVIAINWADGKQRMVGSVTYPHPQIVADPALKEAQFIDDGGLVRVYPTVDDHLVLWILGAPSTYLVPASGGDLAPIPGLPTLYSPDEQWTIKTTLAAGKTTLTLTDRAGNARAATVVTGLVSHVRWAPNGSEVSFTLGHTGQNGGVVQNLYVWDLVDKKAPLAITSNGASFGAEWRGGAVRWVNEPAS